MRFCLLVSVAAFLFVGQASAQRKMKVHISVDMEGIAGVASGSQLGPGSFEYERFRNFMTKEAVAAVNGAKAAGATEIVVADAHGNGENLLIEQFPPDVRIVRAWPRHLGMMGGIDSTFDAAIFIGYHASTNNLSGVRAHTFSSARLTKVSLNGIVVTEGANNAAIAGHYGVPVVMIAGDDAAIAEIRKVVGPLEAAETKKALGFHSTNTLTPAASCELIEKTARAAIANVAKFKPYKINGPVVLEVGLKHYTPVEILGYLKGVTRVDSHTIRWTGADILEVSDFMQFLTHFNLNMEP